MTTPNQPKEVSLSVYIRQPDVLVKFKDMLGESANQYIQSVIIAASASDDLMKCTPQSVTRAALRAASLGLSCDPSVKQAWLVPYNKKVKTANGDQWIKEAQFQPHYLGLYNLAMRTGRYWVINVSPVYEGQRVLENPLTGLHVVVEGNGFVGQPQAYNPAYVDVTNRRRKDMKVIGWIGYFKAKKGNEKSVWMSVEDIEDHARKYVKDYDKNPNWNDSDKRPTMEKKTVLRQLLAWADLSGSENAKLAEALRADTETNESENVIDAPVEDVQPDTDLHPMNIDEARQTLAMIRGKETPLGNIADAATLNDFIHSSMLSDKVAAATMILKEDFRMDPWDAEKKIDPKKAQKELGF